MKPKFFCIVIAVFLLGGCSTHKPMDINEMHSAPDFSALLPEYITVIRWQLNQDLDVADTALFPDLGIADSTSWPLFLTDMNAENLKAAKRFLVVNVPHPDGGSLPLVFLPGKRADYDALGAFSTDHALKRCYSSTGQMMYLPKWEKVKPSNLKNIIKPVSSMKVIEAKKGTKEYDDLMLLLKPFQVAEGKKYLKAIKIRNDYLEAYGIQTGNMLNDDEMEILTKDQDFTEKMIELLGDNWYGVIGFPLLTGAQYGLSIIVMKVYQIPTKFWALNVDRPGYMDGKPTRVETSAMIERHDRLYGFKRYVSPQDNQDLHEILEMYRASKK